MILDCALVRLCLVCDVSGAAHMYFARVYVCTVCICASRVAWETIYSIERVHL